MWEFRRGVPTCLTLTFGTACCPTSFLSPRMRVGSHSPRSSNIRSFPESRSLFAQGTCRDHYNGDRGLDKRLCGTPSPLGRGDPIAPVAFILATDCMGSLLGLQTDIVAVQRKWYGQNWSFAYQWLLVMSTQLIGFSMGGVVKRFLVSPPSMSRSTLSFFGFLSRADMDGFA
jgi:hypothetical protein